MSWLRTIGKELYGLFFDDLGFGLAILACVLLAKLLLTKVPSLAGFSGWVLFAGLALLLLRSALQFTERGRRP